MLAAGEPAVEQYPASERDTRTRMRVTAVRHGISSRYAPAVSTRRNAQQ